MPDLKTPMQGFSSGLESLQRNIHYLLKALKSSEGTSDAAFFEKIDESMDVIILLQSTCTFMNMAINRSLDFR